MIRCSARVDRSGLWLVYRRGLVIVATVFIQAVEA